MHTLILGEPRHGTARQGTSGVNMLGVAVRARRGSGDKARVESDGDAANKSEASCRVHESVG